MKFQWKEISFIIIRVHSERLILDEQTKIRLNNSSWAYSQYDILSDRFESNLIKIREEYDILGDKKKISIFNEQMNPLLFKMKQTYEKLMSIHETIHNTTFLFDKKYHGPFREEVGIGVFNESKRKVVYDFEAYLTTIKSLIDVSIKFAFKLSTVGIPVGKCSIDSFGILKSVAKGNSRYKYCIRIWPTIKGTRYFDEFLKTSNIITQMQNYRDYIIHHGNIDIELYSTNRESIVLFDYEIPKIVRRQGNKYTKRKKQRINLLSFCKETLFLVLTILVGLSDILFEDRIKNRNITALQKFPNSVSKILKKLAGSYDMLRDEKELIAFLNSNDMSFGELVEDFTETSRMHEGLKGLKNEDLSYLRIRTKYKRIHNYEIVKNVIVYDRDFRPHTQREPEYLISKYGTTDNDFPQIANATVILENLRGCLIAFTTRIEGIKRYMCIREGLKEIVQELSGLKDHKRSFIVHDEVEYFRSHTMGEAEETKMIPGDKAEEYMKNKDEGRELLQRKYNELRRLRRQLNPVTIYQTDREIVIDRGIGGNDKVSGLIKKIFYDEFEPVMISDFSPWFENKTLIKTNKGRVRVKSVKFLPDTIFERQLIEKIVKLCRGHFLKNYHSCDIFKMILRKNIYEYIAKVKETRIKLKYEIPNYQYLFPAFEVISTDFFDPHLKKNMSKRDLVFYTHI